MHKLLSWSKKLSHTIGLLQQNCAAFLVTVNLLLYNALFSSTLNYGVLVWGTTTNANIIKLFPLQKWIIRLTCKMPYLSHTAELFSKLCVVRLGSFYEYRLSRYYQLCTKIQDNALQNIAILKTNVIAYNTRNPEQWEVARNCTNYGKKMLCYQLPSPLNRLQQINHAEITNLTLKDVRDMFIYIHVIHSYYYTLYLCKSFRCLGLIYVPMAIYFS